MESQRTCFQLGVIEYGGISSMNLLRLCPPFVFEVMIFFFPLSLSFSSTSTTFHALLPYYEFVTCDALGHPIDSRLLGNDTIAAMAEGLALQ